MVRGDFHLTLLQMCALEAIAYNLRLLFHAELSNAHFDEPTTIRSHHEAHEHV